MILKVETMSSAVFGVTVGLLALVTPIAGENGALQRRSNPQRMGTARTNVADIAKTEVQELITNSMADLESKMEQFKADLEFKIKKIWGKSNYVQSKLSHIKSITDILVPDVCKKGMRRYVHQYVRDTKTLAFPFICDTVDTLGGWIVIQRRILGMRDFNLFWAHYKKGFGKLDDDFWLGNDKIHGLTSTGTFELRVELKYKWLSAYATYSTFAVSSERDNYKLKIGQHSGTAGDSLRYHNSMPFSTWDRDNDRKTDGSCSREQGGGWWFRDCDKANLNGNWGWDDDKGVQWTAFAGTDSLNFSIMKIRRKF